jgi:hypothetical protein
MPSLPRIHSVSSSTRPIAGWLPVHALEPSSRTSAETFGRPPGFPLCPGFYDGFAINIRRRIGLKKYFLYFGAYTKMSLKRVTR